MRQIGIWIAKIVIKWLWTHYRYLLMDAVIPTDSHIHKNPKKGEHFRHA